MTTSILLGGLLLLSAGSLRAGDEGWTDEFDGAKAQARAQGKDLLMDFTGSDWCGWCIKLHKEVFDQAAFRDSIHESFILVKIDFPRDQSLVTDETRAQNAELLKQYPIQGYPTIFLTDADGRPYAQTGYQPDGPEKYLAHLEVFRKAKTERDELFNSAATKAGVERAKLIDQALEKTEPGLLMAFYSDQVEAIIGLDADNAAGLKQKYTALVERQLILKVCEGLYREFQMHARQGRWDELITLLEQSAEEHKASSTVAHHANFFKAIALLEKNELDLSAAALDISAEAEPKGSFSQDIPKIRQAIEDKRAAPDDDDQR